MPRRHPASVRLAEIVRALPRHAHDLSRRTVRESQHWRLLEAITEAVGKLGYADASVADVIAIAGVSRKTFYEHFRDKEECFLTAYEALSERVVAAMNAAGEAHATGRARRRAKLAKYFEVLARDRIAARVFVIDVVGAGVRALAARELVNASFGRAVLGEADELRMQAIVGGVNALTMTTLLRGDGAELGELVGPACAFIESALRR